MYYNTAFLFSEQIKISWTAVHKDSVYGIKRLKMGPNDPVDTDKIILQ